MKFVIILSCLFILLIVACVENTSNKGNQLGDSNWGSQNRQLRNKKLISFDYSSPKVEGYMLDEVSYKVEGDTVFAWFYSNCPVGCMIIGDIQIAEGKIILEFGQACVPNSVAITTEEAELKFEYKIKVNGLKAPPSFSITKNNNLLKKSSLYELCCLYYKGGNEIGSQLRLENDSIFRINHWNTFGTPYEEKGRYSVSDSLVCLRVEKRVSFQFLGDGEIDSSKSNSFRIDTLLLKVEKGVYFLNSNFNSGWSSIQGVSTKLNENVF